MAHTLITPLVIEDDNLEYPSEDGVPMAESDIQRKSLIYCVEALALYFNHDPNVYVSGNLLIYYEKGNIYKSVSPDAFVVLGIPKHDRLSYKIWQEGKAPDVVIEIASKSTWKKDLENRTLYARLGIKEYFQFDPTGEYFAARLLGHWLDDDGTYQPITAETLEEQIIKLESMVLRLELRLEAGQLRLYDPSRAEYLLSYAEAEAERLRERSGRIQAQVQRLDEQAKRLEERSKRLHAEARANQAEAKADQEQAKRLEAEAKADQEQAKRLEAEAQAVHEAQLRAELEARLRKLEAQFAQEHPNT